MHSHPQKSRAGFTLIELALAALLVGIGLVSLITLGRHAMQAALEVEDERRSAALAEDVFATLRSASSHVYQTQGYEGCTNFWQAVTNSNREGNIVALLGEDSSLLHPATWASTERPYIYNAALKDDEFSFPFFQTTTNGLDYIFRPASDNFGTIWEAHYNIDIELKNFLNDASLPPNVVGVTLHIRPRTTYLSTNVETDTQDGARSDTWSFTEYQTFFTHIPLEPLRQTLFSKLSGGAE